MAADDGVTLLERRGGGVARPARVRGTAAAGRPRGRRGGTKSARARRGPFVASAVEVVWTRPGVGGSRPWTRPPWAWSRRTLPRTRPRGREEGRRDRAPWTTPVHEERRLLGQGRGTAVQDVPAHEAAAAGEERGEGGGRAPPHASPRDCRGRDIALRGRMPRGRSWGMWPWRRERVARSRGGSGGPPAVSRGRNMANRGTFSKWKIFCTYLSCTTKARNSR